MDEYEEFLKAKSPEAVLWRAILKQMPGRLLMCQFEDGDLHPAGVVVGDVLVSVEGAGDDAWIVHEGTIEGLAPLMIRIDSNRVKGIVDLAVALEKCGTPTWDDEFWLGVDPWGAIERLQEENGEGIYLGSYQVEGTIPGYFPMGRWLLHPKANQWKLEEGAMESAESESMSGLRPWEYLREGSFKTETHEVFSATDNTVCNELGEAGLDFEDVLVHVREKDEEMAQALEACRDLD